MTSAEYEAELGVFSRLVAEATQFFLTHRAIHGVTARSRTTSIALNQTPLFWNTVAGALQQASLIALGRIFDQKSPHNVDTILRMSEQHWPSLFSKDALAARKRVGNPGADAWLPAYLSRVHVPTAKDIKKLRRFVAMHRKTYDSQVRPIRNRHVAHSEITDRAGVIALYNKAQIRDVERVLLFLNQLHEALWQMFHNGQRPILRPMAWSSRNLVRRKHDDVRDRSVQERAVRDTKMCLWLLTANVKSKRQVHRFSTRKVDAVYA